MAISYCSIADVRVMINANAGTAGADESVLSDAQVTTHIERSESIINAFVGSKYTTPFTAGSIPPIIKSACIDISTYYCLYVLYSRDSQNVNEWIEEFFNKWIDKENKNGILDQIKDGKLPIDLEDGSEAPVATPEVKSNTQTYHTTFDADDPINWTQDEDKLEDIANGRES